jgi:signal transduction histidine kinase
MCTVVHVSPLRFGRMCHGTALRRAGTGGWAQMRGLIAAIVGLWVAAAGFAAGGGAPPTRLYPFEEIGCFSHGAQLAYDGFGRLVVAQQGEFRVLNDTTWQKLWAENTADINLSEVCRGPDGSLLYGAFGSWGVFDVDPAGGLHPRSLVPSDSPRWVRANRFERILCTEAGVFFYGMSGVVFRDTAGRTQFFELNGVACVYPFDDLILVSTFADGVKALDLSRGQVTRAEGKRVSREIIVAMAGDGRSSALLATSPRHLLILQGGRFVPPVGAPEQLPGALTAVVALPEGGFAVSVIGLGVLFLESDGSLRGALSGPEYSGVTELSVAERGVLWAVVETGLLKIHYGQPYTVFGRASGLRVDWPQVVSWRGHPIVASAGRVYELVPDGPLGVPRFRDIQSPSLFGVWGIAAMGDSLLLATGEGVFCAEAEGIRPILRGLRASRLVPLDATTCLVIGEGEIAALRRVPGGWAECAARAPGIGYPYIVHAAPDSAWLELGLNRVARIDLDEGRVRVRLLEEFPGVEPCWVNVSIVGNTAVFCGSWNEPLMLDARSLSPVVEPALRRLFAESPRRIQRLHRDDRGTLWVSHDRGMLRAEERDGRWLLDTRTYAGISGPTPLIRSLPGGDVWVSTGSMLYRLRPYDRQAVTVKTGPVLVSLRNGRTNSTIPLVGRETEDLGRFSYAENSLQLMFFSGSYGTVRPLTYEFRFGDGAWRPSATGSSIQLPDMPEGRYRLQVRTVDDVGSAGTVTNFRIVIGAPWYRSWFAYALYPILAAGLLVGVYRFSVRRSRRRQAELERQVAERTGELRATMHRLQLETQTNATLAERNRLAAEIHDSLEQGFTGLSLQLETTAGLPGCPPPVRSGLNAALSMVGYCRKEIRHSIQGLHSPILGSVDLGTAITLIVRQLVPATVQAAVRIEGDVRRIDSATEHHLLRIAQEALANAVKHARANRIEVVLSFSTTALSLSVSDDGCGFDPESVAGGIQGRFGLPSFRNRAAKIGGALRMTSQPGAGTVIFVCVPYQHMAEAESSL